MNQKVVTKFAKLGELKDELYPFLQPGDLVEFKRAVLSHFSVYVGFIGDIHCVIDFVYPDDANLISLFCKASLASIAAPSGPSSQASQASSVLGTVRLVPIVSILGGDEVRINNSLDGQPHPPSASQVIVDRAIQQFHAGERNYDLFRANCEHFATFCRYGVSLCSQVDAILKKKKSKKKT